MKSVSIIGLGYVGLPLALAFANKIKTIGYDINKKRIEQLKKFVDVNNQLKKEMIKSAKKINFSDNIDEIFESQIIIITLPTPINKRKKPDLKNIKNFCKILGKKIKKNTIIIFESTLYPGATRNDFLPIIKKYSKLTHLKDFYIGYSPERINVGDKKNSVQNITKLISGDCDYSTKKILDTYKLILNKNIFITDSIETAEAAKVFENTQRDVNISLMNELSMVCNKLNLNTKNVLDAAATKWNFIKFQPGLVGGHCISVDPYYLSYCAKKVGHKTTLINAGRKINNDMSNFIAKDLIQNLGKNKNKKILVLGLTFKENCADIRDSKIFDLINKLKKKYIIFLNDPYAIKDDVKKKYGYSVTKMADLPNQFDCIVINLLHDYYKKNQIKYKILKLLKKKGSVYDLKGLFNPVKLRKKNIKVFNL